MPSATPDPSSTTATDSDPSVQNAAPSGKPASTTERVKELIKSVLPASVWNPKARWRFIQKSLEKVGYKVKRKKSPAPRAKAATKPAARTKPTRAKPAIVVSSRPSALNGVRYDLRRMKATLTDLLPRYRGEFDGSLDAVVLYAMVRNLKPKRLLQIGCGDSAQHLALAIAKNASESHPAEVTSLPSTAIPEGEVATSLQEMGLQPFGQLSAGDLLFVGERVWSDSQDAAWLVLEVLPTLKQGVHVHLPRVPFPHHIAPQADAGGDDETDSSGHAAQLMQAFLAFNTAFIVEMSASLLRQSEEHFPAEQLSAPVGPAPLHSLWLRRLGLSVVELPVGIRS